MTNRSKRAQIAKQTLAIIENGAYENSKGDNVDVGQWTTESIARTKTYSPEQLDSIQNDVSEKLNRQSRQTDYCVANATTFAMAAELIQERPSAKVLCLNFASAKNPGGGFLGGSQAQEEALCRASALYSTINPQREYYETNRACGTCLYTDYMIYSPDVPVFRDDDDQLLDDPYRVSVVTAPAVNTGALANSEHEKLPQVIPVMRSRIEKLLSIAVAHDYEHLVLGAWGCGVFRNDPAEIAELFHAQLVGNGRFASFFESVRFGVLDFTMEATTYAAFESCFSKVKT